MLLRRLLVLALLVALLPNLSWAALNYSEGIGPGGEGILNDVIAKFDSAASQWSPVILQAARYLFWSLATISLVWTFGLLALQKADIQEFFAEFVKFIIPLGFFLWILENAVTGQNIAGSIVDSLRMLGAQAGGAVSPSYGTTKLGPSDIVNVGFDVVRRTSQALDDLSWRDFGLFITLSALATIVCIVMAIIAINLAFLLITSYLLLYAGVFFLGFGGGRWTSDIAISYYRNVLGVSAQLFTMILIVGLGKDILYDFINAMSETPAYEELLAILIVALMLLFLVNKVPTLIGSIPGPSGGGGVLGGGFGAGAAMGALATGGAALTSGGAAAYSAIKAGAQHGYDASLDGAAVLRAAVNIGVSGAKGDIDTSPMFGGETSREDLPPLFDNVAGATPIKDDDIYSGASSFGVSGPHFGRNESEYMGAISASGIRGSGVERNTRSSQLGSGLGLPPMENGHETEIDREAEAAAFVNQGKFPDE
ncbi:MAG: type IV secretion system protein VirB6/type IV secretion system protein TrbL [Zhongshania marina]|jgi:type IV secretion system protein TrbL